MLISHYLGPKGPVYTVLAGEYDTLQSAVRGSWPLYGAYRAVVKYRPAGYAHVEELVELLDGQTLDELQTEALELSSQDPEFWNAVWEACKDERLERLNHNPEA